MNHNEFSEKIDQNTLLGMRIIFGSFLMGALVYLGVTVMMFFMMAPETTDYSPIESISTKLTIISFVLLTGSIPMSSILFQRFLKVEKQGSAEVTLGNIRTSILIRVALLEGVTLFALTSLLLAVMDGYIYANPIIWINLVPLGYFALHVLMNFPSRAQITEIYRMYYTNSETN